MARTMHRRLRLSPACKTIPKALSVTMLEAGEGLIKAFWF
jgi:hypothetical protein